MTHLFCKSESSHVHEYSQPSLNSVGALRHNLLWPVPSAPLVSCIRLDPGGWEALLQPRSGVSTDVELGSGLGSEWANQRPFTEWSRGPSWLDAEPRRRGPGLGSRSSSRTSLYTVAFICRSLPPSSSLSLHHPSFQFLEDEQRSTLNTTTAGTKCCAS